MTLGARKGHSRNTSRKLYGAGPSTVGLRRRVQAYSATAVQNLKAKETWTPIADQPFASTRIRQGDGSNDDGLPGNGDNHNHADPSDGDSDSDDGGAADGEMADNLLAGRTTIDVSHEGGEWEALMDSSRGKKRSVWPRSLL